MNAQELSVFMAFKETLKRDAQDFKEKQVTLGKIQIALKKLGAAKYDPKQHQEIKRKRSALEQTEKQFLKIDQDLKRLPGLQISLNKGIDKIDRELIFLSQIEKKAAELKFDKSELNKMTHEEEKLQNQKDKKQILYTNMKSAYQKLDFEIQGDKNALEDQKQRQALISKKKKSMETLEILNGYVEQFKTMLLAKITPSISLQAGQMFSTLTQGQYESIEVNAQFEFFIQDQGNKFPINRFSGGEVDLANLCLRIAIGKAVADLAGSPGSEFLAFDEIFGSQDESRRFNILIALNNLAESYRQILIISHVQDLKEEFPYLMEVRKEAGISKIKVL